MTIIYWNPTLFSQANTADFEAYPRNRRRQSPVLDADSVKQKLNIATLLTARVKQITDGADSTLNCINCGNVITYPIERIEKSGQHSHTFSNPHGIEFKIGCFASAVGVVEKGPPIERWSWFSGSRWQISLCRQCYQHLGWCFSNGDSFFGLILTRLVETKNNPRSR